MQQTKLLRSMRSVRRFSPKPIPDDVLLDILEAGRWTGSWKNIQPWELIVVRNRQTLGKMASMSPFGAHLAGAQVGIALLMEGAQEPYGFDAGRLAQTLMLAAWAHGVGSCIATLVTPNAGSGNAQELLGFPPDRHLWNVISLGYSADVRAARVGPQSSVRSQVPLGRKPLSEFVSWERYGQDKPST
ncbi:MAG: nitroreductase [Dehalococcoidia bacterium]|nr:nitroreductase [Dehalococcoidia bacterium]